MARILVVDDEANVRDLVRRFLTEAGHEVLEASDGEAAYRSASVDNPDMVVLDIVMPGLGGMATLDRLKSGATTRDIPVFVLTGHGTDRVRERSMSKGAADFMAKPFHPRTLLSRVQKVLEKSSAVGARQGRGGGSSSVSTKSASASDFVPAARRFVGEHFGFTSQEMYRRIGQVDLAIKRATPSEHHTVYELDGSALVFIYGKVEPVSKDFSMSLAVNKDGQVVDRRGQFYE